MTFKPTVGKRMKAVAHNQQLNRAPSGFGGVETIGVIDPSTGSGSC